MRSLALTTALSLGGCSLLATTRHPQRDRSGAPTCHSYVLPAMDTVVATAGLALGGLLVYMAHDDPELHGAAFAIGVPSLLIGIPSAIGAVVGFRDIPKCRRELP